jgi:hypothetical protein
MYLYIFICLFVSIYLYLSIKGGAYLEKDVSGEREARESALLPEVHDLLPQAYVYLSLSLARRARDLVSLASLALSLFLDVSDQDVPSS